jgi:hypothetical protein
MLTYADVCCQLDEGGSQLQIAHSRILTLENRIRENEVALQDHKVAK